ncbi:hypothetical protein [Reinekea marinisedimentorum]
MNLTSFGGPAAHIGYFRKELIKKQHWRSAIRRAVFPLIAVTSFTLLNI